MSWFRRDGDKLFIAIHAQPGAKRTEVQGMHGEALKVRVSAPPIDGRANAELQRFLAQAFEVPLRDVTQTGGETSRQKRFCIAGSRVDPESLTIAKL